MLKYICILEHDIKVPGGSLAWEKHQTTERAYPEIEKGMSMQAMLVG